MDRSLVVAGPSGSGSSARGQKRRHTNSDSASGGKKKSRGPMPPSASRARRDQHHVAKKDVPEEHKGLKDALQLHIRILWRLFTAESIPNSPSNITIAAFQQRFTSAAELEVFMKTLTYKHKDTSTAVRDLRLSLLGKRGIIARNVTQIDEVYLHTIFSAVLQFGLIEWCPDILASDANSMYNSAHELIALRTFQQVAASHAYVRLGPNLTNLGDMALLRQWYRNFVFSYMYKKARAETLEPGRWALRMANLARAKECHSDDESTRLGNSTVYLIKKKVARNPNVKKFFRWSSISRRFPKRAPLDWFDPEYFNSLPANLRARYRKGGISLPLPQHWQNTDFQTMADAEFMERYGNEVLKLYKLPTKEELDGMKRNAKDDGSEWGDDESSDESELD
ncbi:hypothetical protein C8R43DRAFT_892749 [Mycena crocata]|nr:hypothetical protein C8R43DRAFT_892749 [Mycena crocata]